MVNTKIPALICRYAISIFFINFYKRRYLLNGSHFPSFSSLTYVWDFCREIHNSCRMMRTIAGRQVEQVGCRLWVDAAGRRRLSHLDLHSAGRQARHRRPTWRSSVVVSPSYPPAASGGPHGAPLREWVTRTWSDPSVPLQWLSSSQGQVYLVTGKHWDRSGPSGWSEVQGNARDQRRTSEITVRVREHL